ncbi:excalibur calcium-binding domain-containing protein [Cytobacillus pseudoceanisediminis]|uniref:excalibur calcium-binding domain-containing protein n=1 Tax=Cytobacillus pseudoceanisediminis TaxID=3051614 RepID=UPI003C304BFD
MEKWIGNHPTVSQKALKVKYGQILNRDKWAVLGEKEQVLKIIEGELDKRGGKEVDGIVALTDTRILFISRSENSSYNYSSINNIRIAEDGKDKHQWKLSFSAGGRRIVVDDIAKNDDSDEYFFILNHKVQNPNRRIETTVTHDFSYFLHAGRLDEFRKQNVVITPFLLKRDNQGSNANGLRLLKEIHPNALFIVPGNLKKEKAEGDFIVVDDLVYLYKYDNKERVATLLYSWVYGAFNGVTLDYFALKTVVTIDSGELTFNSKGKEFADLLAEKGAFFTIQKRKWHQKILGFRSGKLWKKSVASISYLLILLVGMAMIYGDDESKNKKTPDQSIAETNAETQDENKEADEKARLTAEQKAKDEEAARLAAEQKTKEQEAARIAAEQKAKEEAAEKKAEEEEAARLAAEKKAKEEEAARLAAEQKAQEEAAANVFYKNCDAVKAAGAAPIRTGDPGYSRKLDRDGDGIACEW